MQGKTVHQSVTETSYIMMPQDANPSGNVHGGIIMRHVDNTAGMVAFRHARSNVVTASIDRLDFFHPGFIGDLLTLKASLNYAGTTSMEIGVRAEMENVITGEIRHVASAYLIFVALDSEGHTQKIPALVLETEEDERRNCEALERKKTRVAQQKSRAGCQS
jgi:acyl-CoA hydrolase